MIRRFVCSSIALFVLVFAAYAQETSVAPGINKNFEEPDVERYTNMFEGESRAIYTNREGIVDAFELKEGMDVADVGAGTGFFSMMFADRVGPKGTVYAVDIAENFVDHIKKRAKDEGHKNVKTVLCTDRDAKLKKNSVDAVFICDTYHHFEYPFDTLASIHEALRPGGKLMVVDFERVKGVSTSFAINHVRSGKGTVTDEIKDSGFDFVKEVPLMEEQWIRIFVKRESDD